jgi:hypothetical protein
MLLWRREPHYNSIIGYSGSWRRGLHGESDLDVAANNSFPPDVQGSRSRQVRPTDEARQ